MDEAAQLELKKYYSYSRYFGFALVGLVFIYAVAVEVIQWRHAPFGGVGTFGEQRAFVGKMLRYLLLLVSAVELGGTIIIWKFMKYIATSTGGLFDIPGKTPAFKLFYMHTIIFAMCNSVAIYGLVLFLVTSKAVDFYLFMAISLAFFYIFFPKYERWEKLLESGTSS